MGERSAETKSQRSDLLQPLYRARNLIERFFNKIKQCRRVATRYDKLAANYLAFIKLASIRIWLRPNESATKCLQNSSKTTQGAQQAEQAEDAAVTTS